MADQQRDHGDELQLFLLLVSRASTVMASRARTASGQGRGSRRAREEAAETEPAEHGLVPAPPKRRRGLEALPGPFGGDVGSQLDEEHVGDGALAPASTGEEPALPSQLS